MIFIFTFIFIFFNSFMYQKYSELPYKEKRIGYAFGYVVGVIALIYFALIYDPLVSKD